MIFFFVLIFEFSLKEFDFDDAEMSPVEGGGFVNDEVLGDRVEEDDPSDLTDVFFESVDDLMTYGNGNEEKFEDMLHYAQDRMDEGFSTEEEENINQTENQQEIFPPDSAVDRRKIDDKFLQKVKLKIAEHAVLEGDPVHSLYSRANVRAMLKDQHKINPANIAPQRRPRPQHLITRYSRVSLPSIYKNSFDHLQAARDRLLRHRISRYNVPRMYQKPSFAPTYRAQPKIYSSSINGWNPQASFPKSLSNPRFKKYIDTPVVPLKSQLQPSRRESRTSKSLDTQNLKLNHLMEPSSDSNVRPSSSTLPPVLGPTVTHGTLDVQTPHYFFNLTSHLIRSQNLDPKIRNFRNREPRSV